MSNKQPSVPPANRSDKGPGSDPRQDQKSDLAQQGKAPANADKQGQQGNTKVNTTNKGYQQDR
jgi:hypothetical protein